MEMYDKVAVVDVFDKDYDMKKEYRLAYFQDDGKLKVFEREHETREEVQRIIKDLKNPRRRYAVAERDVSEWRISQSGDTSTDSEKWQETTVENIADCLNSAFDECERQSGQQHG